MEVYCYVRNIVDILMTNETAHHRRFSVGCHGPVYPFGCEIKYKPISQNDIARCRNYGRELLPGIFLGKGLHAGGGWSRDLLVADWDEIQEAELFSEIHPRRCKAPEIFSVLRVTSDKHSFLKFPIAEGHLRQPSGHTTEVVRRELEDLHLQIQTKEKAPLRIRNSPK